MIPVGEAWNRAIETGVADPNPYDGIDAGKLNLWTFDNYHASTHGYYLEALMVFGSVTGRDPRSLGENECSAFELGISTRRGQERCSRSRSTSWQRWDRSRPTRWCCPRGSIPSAAWRGSQSG